MIKDPPFSKLDLISCRNLLIYLGPVLQKRALNIFHYALNAEGFLLLGSSESIGEFANLYGAVDAKAKVYSKKTVSVRTHIDFTLHHEPAFTPQSLAEPESLLDSARFDIQRETDRLLINKYVPAAVLVDEHLEIKQFRGQTGPYFEPAPGEPSFNLLRMAREDLMVDLNSVMKEVKKTHVTTEKPGVRINYNGRSHVVDIEVTPLKLPGRIQELYLIVFKDRTPPEKGGVEAVSEVSKTPVSNEEAQRLKQELTATQEYLQTVIEQQETSNEELRSAYEEIQSSNEELQSINEELETAKEELQSTNEELATVNDELESRNKELKLVNDDLSNLIGSVNIPMIIVGQDLRIRRFSPGMEKLFNLIAADLGRPLSNIKPNIDIPRFIEIVTEVIDTVQSHTLEVQNGGFHWFSVRIHPYRTMDNKIDGAVIAFIDIDQIKSALDAASAAQKFAESVIEAVRHPMLVLDKDLRVVSASAAYREVFQVTEKELIGNLLYRLGNGQWGVPELRAKLEEVMSHGNQFNDLVITHDFPGIGNCSMSVSGRQIPAGAGNEAMVLMQIEDTTGGEAL